jgi:hypothetical protein
MSYVLPAPATGRFDAYLSGRGDTAQLPVVPG